ncbi:hypothetical protein ABW21_db0209472 [Orbilia brochopaga]|nr:hypothetical protein ABW21_db0209472 [Drechslerella brochopaga]
MSQLPATSPPILTAPQISHPQSPRPPPSPTISASSSSTATDDISDSGEDDLAPAIMEPSDFDFLTHGDLRSPGRESARERSLRKKAPHHRGSSHHHSAAAAHTAPPVDPGVQPQYPSDDEEDKRKSMTPEERARARKKAKKTAKADKKRALKAQEPVKNPRKREDRRREDEVAAVEASMASLRTTDNQEEGEPQPQEEDAATSTNTTTTPSTLSTHDRQQRRRSSNTLPNRPVKPRKTSSSGQAGSGSGSIKSPKLGTDADDASVTSGTAKRGSAKYAAAFTQYNVEEGLHERAHNIDSQMADLAKREALNEMTRGGKLARGLEELEKRKMERKQNEALKDVVEAAQVRYEDEQLARLYGLK